MTQQISQARRGGVAAMAALLLLGLLVVMTVTVATARPAGAWGSSAPPPIPSVSAGGYMTCGVQSDATAACWGENGVPSNDIAQVHPGGAATPPAGVQFLEVNAGYATACGVKTDQSIVCWGNGRFEKVQRVPAGTYKHVSPGLGYVCAIRTDDTIRCWGGDIPTTDAAQKVIRDVPAGQFSQVSVGNRHACALRSDGSGAVVCWGHSTAAPTAPTNAITALPAGTYKAVNVASNNSCALKTDGTPVCWGAGGSAMVIYPKDAGGNLLTFDTLSTGTQHACGLRPDKTIACWGSASQGATSPPGGPTAKYTQVSAGNFHSCGIREGGTRAVCWGNNMSGRVQPNMTAVQPPAAYAGVAYNATFTMNPSPQPSATPSAGAQVGVSPAPSFTLVEGELPPGLTFSPSGAVSGTPTAAGSFTVKVAASNGLSPTDCSNLSLTGDSMFCTPGDPNSVATATRVLTFNVGTDAPAPGAVAGRVTKTDGSAVGGATVKVTYNDSTAVAQTTTDADGNYTVSGLSPEGYKVTASGEGVVTATQSATITSEQTTTVDFSVTPRLTRPQIVGAWSNHWQTVADGMFVEWSEEFDVLQQVGDGYSVHGPGDSSCTGAAVASGVVSNWLGENPNTTTPRVTSRTRDIEMPGYENVTPGGTYHLRVAANTEFGASTGQQNVLTCLAFTAGPRPLDRGAVSGKVTDSVTGAPIAGATVAVKRTIRQPGTVAGQATSNASGDYVVGNLPPSTYGIGGYSSPYEVVVSAPGYSSKTGSANTTFSVGTATVPGSTSSATLNVTLSNSAPDAVDDAYSTDEDTALSVNAPGVLANDTDPQGDALSAAVATGPANGTLGLNADGSFTYTPNANFNGADSFTYTATDSLGASDTATVAITVNPVNDAPVAVGESYTHHGSDTALVVAAPGVLGNDADPVEGSPLTAVLVSGPASGTLALDPNGSFTYQPNEDFGGADSFTYKANDGAADSNVVTVSITVGAGCRGQQATKVGTSGSDRLTGTTNADVIAGLGGNDTISGAAGNDIVCGGSGNDTVNVGTGDDYGEGGSGDDSVKGDIGNDTLLGGAGADTVNGDAGNDVLSGGAGAPDNCQAGGGTDSLTADHGCEKIGGVP